MDATQHREFPEWVLISGGNNVMYISSARKKRVCYERSHRSPNGYKPHCGVAGTSSFGA